MTLRFASLGSGSKGNATLVESGNTCLLLDCGFSTREVEKRLTRLDRSAEGITAILVTHEHTDHVNGVGRLSRKYRIPVYMTSGSWSRCRTREEYPFITLINSHVNFNIEGLEVRPYPVPHDAQEPVQFVFSDGLHSLGVLTDSGSVTPHIIKMLDGLDALLLEGNHDIDMLMDGDYPEYLKNRVSGRLGHLSNAQAAGLLGNIDCSNLQHIVAAHLSEKNNHPDRVIESFSDALNCSADWVELASQKTGFDWKELAQ